MATTGIYLITRVETGQMYVGQSVNIERRFKQHKRQHKNSHVDCAIRKYGAAAFAFDILEECPEKLLNARETFWIDAFDTFDNPDMEHYNHQIGGGRRRFSEETLRKIGEASKGRRHSAESRAKMSAAHKGRRFTDKHRANLSASVSAAKSGRKWTEGQGRIF